jgi:hypothetical protein
MVKAKNEGTFWSRTQRAQRRLAGVSMMDEEERTFLEQGYRVALIDP